MKAALLGHGTIGVGVDRIAASLPEIDIVRVLALETDDEILGRHTFHADDILNDPEIDTVIEVMGGIHPAWEFLSRAMKAGKNVVTANKAVVAAYYRELVALSLEHHVAFRCTAAVGGGIPWLVSLEREKRGDCIRKIGGIMNGTTNFILSRMARDHMAFNDALLEAQRLGYAEKDPSADIDGDDVRRKLSISASVAYDCFVDETKIPTAGIRFVTTDDLAFGTRTHSVLKLAAFSRRTEKGVSAFVSPVFIPVEELLASVPENVNLLTLTAEHSGELSFAGQGAGRYPTAKNVVLDLLDIVSGVPAFYTDHTAAAEIDNLEECYSWYFRSTSSSLLPAEIVEETSHETAVTKKLPVPDAFRYFSLLKETDPEAFIAAIL